jgi:hypothetical protein
VKGRALLALALLCAASIPSHAQIAQGFRYYNEGVECVLGYGLCILPVNPLSIAYGGTAGTTASVAINNLLPSQTGNSGDCLGTNGTAASWVSCGTGGSTIFQANATNLSSSSTVNFENSSATNGLTLTFANPSAGNVQLGITGWPTLVSGDCLTNNGTSLSWTTCGGASTTFQANGTGLSSSSTVNFESSAATNGLTLTFSNPSAGNVQLGLTGFPTLVSGDCLTNNGSALQWGTCGGSGSVTTTGSPASGELAEFSGASSITNGNLSGDVTTSGTLAATVVKVNGAAVPASATFLGSNSSSQLVSASITVADSVSGAGTSGSPLELSGDSSAPGDSYFYGTNSSGTKGWQAGSTVLTGTTGSIGGGSLANGACATGTVTLSGVTTSMVIQVTPQTFPGAGFWPMGYVSATNTVTVEVCNATGSTGTPTASTYNVVALP